ncbi:MAG: hypothetical protein IJI04_07240 [Lachnospiraceae bacterium]|nr:hypothetical protein [Lachnospiraceae bacterium]
MSVLEQYTYDGSRKPDFQTLPTLVVPDEAMPADGAEASGNDGDDREIQIREQLKEKAKANLVEIGRLQKAFHAAKKRGLIVILQGMPYSGRTETNQYLKKAMKGGVKIYSYRKGESTHDFLWQMHKKTPKYGNICLMNSSVYADIPETEGGAERVRAFEKYLKASGISVVRIFLHVSSNRQKKRMLEVITTKPGGAPREMPKDKGWRKEYLERFAEVIAAATPETPWYVIPADSKWYARCLVTEIVRDALRECVGSDEPLSVEEQTLAIEEMVPEIVEAEVVKETSAEEPIPAEMVADTEVATPETEPAAVQDVVAEEQASAEMAADTEAATPETEPAEVEEVAAETVSTEETAAEEPAAFEEAVAEEAPAEEPAAPEEAPAEPEKKPARRTRRKKAETPAETEAAEKKPAARRQRRQGAPKTVEETLARRRKRMGSD